MSKPLRIGIVAGEASGDILGSGLIQAIRTRHPDAVFEGIGGPQMIAEGFHTYFPMERLSVMGLFEVLGRLFEILKIRRFIRRHFTENPPDLFIGIDSPDFNLPVEDYLHKRGIKTAHYVSPSVWAWRQRRVFKIARAVDLMLTLLPFEAKFYRNHSVPVRFVGHPLADQIPLEVDREAARQSLGIDRDATVIAVLPGSRAGEIHYLGQVFLETAVWLKSRQPDLHFVLPAANAERKAQILEIQARLAPDINLTIVDGRSREVMSASNAILIASGTATLEAALIKRPMVVAYRMSALTYFIASRLVKTAYISLPNLLADKLLVPELIQAQASPEKLGKAMLERLEESEANRQLAKSFLEIHMQLRQNASEKAADAVLQLIAGSRDDLLQNPQA